MEKRYRALRIVATLYKIVGVIVLVIAVLSGIGICLAGVLGGTALEGYARQVGGNVNGIGFLGSALGGIITALVTLIGGLLSGLSLFAVGEGISLALAIEENTRSTALHLAAVGRQMAPPPPTAPEAPFVPPVGQA